MSTLRHEACGGKSTLQTPFDPLPNTLNAAATTTPLSSANMPNIATANDDRLNAIFQDFLVVYSILNRTNGFD
jgi:hypothetical protein